MKTVLRVMALSIIAVSAISGCSVNMSGDDAASRHVGSDYFGAGGFVNLTDPVEGDAFLAGGQVATAGEVGGDLVAAGGQVSIGGSVGDDLYAAGGDVKVDSMVRGNARVGGGDIAVGPATVIAGSATLVGGRVNFEGDSHGYLHISGGTVTIDGIVHGDAEVRSEELVLGPETRIGGRLAYWGPTAPVVPEGAVITGGVEFHEATHGDYMHQHHGPMHHAVHWFGHTLWFAGVFFVGALFLILFPGFSSRAADTVGREPLQSAGLGFAALACVPFLAVVLLITIIGIPLALLLVPLYLLLLFLGWIVATLFVGQRGLAALRGARPATTGWHLLELLLGLVALALLRHLPFVGGLIAFVALIAGMGALVTQGWAGRHGAPAGGG
jgi:hypothetical protein